MVAIILNETKRRLSCPGHEMFKVRGPTGRYAGYRARWFMSHERDTAVVFQHRRETTWRTAKPWVLVLAAAWLSILVIPIARIDPFLFSFAIIVVVTIRVNFIVMKYYRCPACDKIPIISGSRGGLALDPDECPKCGALLKDSRLSLS